MSYEDARRRARLIAEVTASRFMPPWKPRRGYGAFDSERRLGEEGIATLSAWSDAGAPPGDLATAPSAPSPPAGWQLGTPERELWSEATFVLPTGQTDAWRTFVLAGADEDRFVRAVEFRIEPPDAAHHLALFVDDDARHGLNGRVEDVGVMFEPDSGVRELLGWAPGSRPFARPAGLAWRLPAGAQLLVDTHFVASGKALPVRVGVGLHYADAAPQRVLSHVRMGSASINVPPGCADYRVDDAFVLPEDVTILALFPHAHRVCRAIRVRAIGPTGDELPLLWIDDWDFDWQDCYRLAEALELTAGTRIEATFWYDNSSANPALAYTPPRRVLGGLRAEDEMATVFLLVSVADDAGAQALRHALAASRAASPATNGELQRLWHGLLLRCDADGDGSLDADEEAAANTFLDELASYEEELLPLFDANGDGALDVAERETIAQRAELWRTGEDTAVRAERAGTGSR